MSYVLKSEGEVFKPKNTTTTIKHRGGSIMLHVSP